LSPCHSEVLRRVSPGCVRCFGVPQHDSLKRPIVDKWGYNCGQPRCFGDNMTENSYKWLFGPAGEEPLSFVCWLAPYSSMRRTPPARPVVAPPRSGLSVSQPALIHRRPVLRPPAQNHPQSYLQAIPSPASRCAPMSATDSGAPKALPPDAGGERGCPHLPCPYYNC